MNRLVITIVFLVVILFRVYANVSNNDDGFIQTLNMKEYDKCLNLIENGAPYAKYLAHNQISWDNYVQLMEYAHNVGHQYLDSLAITGMRHLSYYALKSSEKGYFQNSIDLMKVVILLTKVTKSPEYQTMMGAYNQIASNFYNLGDNTQAVQYADSALSLANKIGADSISYTVLYDNLGLYCYYATMYDKAKEYFDKACNYSRSLPNDHNEKQRLLSNASLFLVQVGQLDKARIYLEESLCLARITNSPYIPTILNNLCSVCLSVGEYEKAIEYGELALSILDDSVLSETQNRNGESLLMNNLALGYYYLNNLDKALLYAKKSYQLYDSRESNEVSTILANLALIYKSIDVQESVKYYKLSLEKTTPNNLIYSFLQNNIALLYWEIDDYKRAKLHMDEAYKNISDMGPLADPSHLAIVTMNLSELYRQLGEKKKSIGYMKDAVKIATNAELSLDMIALMKSNLAFTYFMQTNNTDRSYLALGEALSDYAELASKQFDFLTEKERNMYWEKSGSLRTFIPAFVNANYKKHPEYATLAYNNALQTKGILLHTSSAVTNALSGSNDTILSAKWKELCNIRQILASPAFSSYHSYLDSLREEGEKIETWLMKESKQYRDNQVSLWNVDWKSVQKKLDDGEVAIEFIRFMPFKNKKLSNDYLYAALVIRREYTSPIMVPLCKEGEIREVMNNPNITYHEDNLKPYQLIWAPLSNYLNHGDRIFFSPDGLLYQINIEALHTPTQKLLSEKYNMNRLSSTRELVMERQTTNVKSAVLYGGLYYDVDTIEMVNQSRKYHEIKSNALRGDGESRIGVKYLPGTESEIISIAKCLSVDSVRYSIYTAENGSEESFKSLSGKDVNILHIATHGFFHNQEETQAKDMYKIQLRSLDDNGIRYIDPLMRSGLMLSGANLAYQGLWGNIPNGVQDGVLYSKEIALLNLTSVDLVVLSACQTGQGDINGEGVFGLQRAFKQAGVKTLIMSLWKVNDVATQLLMTEFYKNWISLKQNKHDAFNNARNAVKQLYEEPVYWAGFIMLD